MNDLERADPPLRRLLFYKSRSSRLGRGCRGEILVGWALWLVPMQPKSSGSSRFPVYILTKRPRFLAMSACCQSDTRKWTRLVYKRGVACVFEQRRSGVFCYSDMSGQGNYSPRLCVPAPAARVVAR